MINKRNKKIAITLIITGVTVYIGFFIYQGFDEIKKNPFKFTEIVPKNYVNLFNKDSLQKFTIKGTMAIKLRNDISYLLYNHKYNVELTKINTISGFNFRNDIVEKSGNVEGKFPTGTVPWDEGECNTTYRTTSTEEALKIYLSLNGDSVTTILKNDSIAYYYLKLKNAYIQYSPNGTYEMTAETKQTLYFFDDKPPLSLLFIKKENTVYFLLLTVDNNTKNLDSQLLYKLIKL